VAATPLSAMIYKQKINKNKGKFKEKSFIALARSLHQVSYRANCLFSLLQKMTETTCMVNCKYFLNYFKNAIQQLHFFTQKTRVADPDPDLVLFAGQNPNSPLHSSKFATTYIFVRMCI
jgi:hypothetical protein